MNPAISPSSFKFLQAISCIMFLATSSISSALAVSEAEIEQIISAKRIDVAQLRGHGQDAIPHLVSLYEKSDEERRAVLAWAFYQLRLKSPEAKRVLMKDAHTSNPRLRLQVQWALGRVSDDSEVVTTLLDNMQNDPNPLFRDKAACALASDQVHLTPEKKVKLYAGLIEALDDPKLQVRRIAIQALKIQTGQTKTYTAAAAPDQRKAAIKKWKAWLVEYERNL